MTATSAPVTTPERRTAPVPGGLAAAVVGALVLAAVNAVTALTPGMHDATDASDMLQVARDEAPLLELGNALALLTAALLVPGIWAVGSRLAPRTPRLSAVGTWLMATGYVFSVVLPFEMMTMLAVARAGGDPGSFLSAVDDHTPATLIATYTLFGLGALVGTLVLGVAALRQRDTVPAWVGWALVVSPVVRMAGLALGLSVGPTLASLLIAAAFVGVWRGRR